MRLELLRIFCKSRKQGEKRDLENDDAYRIWYIYLYIGFYIRGFYSWEGFGRIYGTILVRHFGKPVFGFQKSNSKGNPHWRRMVFFGKRPAGFILAVQWNPFDFGKVCQKDQHLLERSFGVLL